MVALCRWAIRSPGFCRYASLSTKDAARRGEGPGECPAPSLGLAEDVYNEMGCCDEDLDDPEDDHRFHFHPLPKV